MASKMIRCDELVRKGPAIADTAEWVQMYEQYERALLTKHISRQAAENVVKAARALAESDYSGPVAVVDLFTAKAETERGGARVLYAADSYAIVSDARGEIAQAQAMKTQRPYDGGLFSR